MGNVWLDGRTGSLVGHREGRANNGRKKKLDEILDAPAADDDSYRISISA